MNISKHTPGPWTKGTSNEGKECVWLNGFTEPFYGMGPDHTWIDCITEANANLVSAAPELLDALILAWPIIEHERFKQDGSYGSNFAQHKADRARQAHAKARAAIAKANGEQV